VNRGFYLHLRVLLAHPGFHASSRVQLPASNTRYRQSPSETASIVIIPTLLAALRLPLLLAYVIP